MLSFQRLSGIPKVLSVFCGVLSRSTLLSKLKDFLWTRAETSVEGTVKRFLRFGELDGECWLNV